MRKVIEIKESIFGIVVTAAGFISNLWGGCSELTQALLVCMVVDYVTGSIVALVFHASPKTESGAGSSRAGLIGLCKKVSMLLIVLVGTYLEAALGVKGLQTGLAAGFILNELLSITENCGLMGVKLPPGVERCIDILRKVDDTVAVKNDERRNKL